MRRDHGESVNPNDSGPVGVLATPAAAIATKPKLAELGESEPQKKSNEKSSVESPMVPTKTTITTTLNTTIRDGSTIQSDGIIGSNAKIQANSNSPVNAALSGDNYGLDATAASPSRKSEPQEDARDATDDTNIDAGNEKATLLKQRGAMMKHCKDAANADKKQQANSMFNSNTINDNKLDDENKTPNRNCSEMILAMNPEFAKAAAAAAAANRNNNSSMEHDSSSPQSQAPGCETGETGDEKKTPQQQNNPAIPTLTKTTALAATEPFARKRGRHFLWKETSNSEPTSPTRSSCKKTKLHHDGGAETINKSNWGKLREQLFRFVRPQNSNEDTHAASIAIQVDDPPVEINGLLAMHKILVSPYEGNRSAEIGEEPLDRWKQLMKPVGDDEMNPLLSELYGDPLAKTIFSAKIEIASLEHLFETSWKWGKIGSLSLGWIPKRQLLLCLDENKIMSPTTVATPVARQHNTIDDTKDSKEDGNGTDEKSNDDGDDDDDNEEKDSKSEDEEDAGDDDDEEDDERGSEMEALRKVARKLECFELVIAAMREWKLKYEYPELYSSKDVGEYIFQKIEEGDESNHGSESETANNEDNETKKNCYKCLIFVARVFCALLLFNEEQKAPASLMQKVRACLAIMNTHARAHPSELARILKKKKRKEEGPKKPKPAKKRRTSTIVGTLEEREATLMASFGHVKRESETLLKMMDYYKTRLLLVTPEQNDDDSDGDDDEEHNSSHFQPHMSFMESMEEEIVSNAKREFAHERRFRKKIALARQNGSKS